MAAKTSKAARSHKGGDVSVTAKVTGADGVEYTVCGCCVDDVRAVVDEVRGPQPAAGGEPGVLTEGGGATGG